MSREERQREEIAEAVDTGIDLFTLVQDILHNWWAIILGALAGAMLFYVAANIKYVPEYTSTATFVVGSKESNYSYSNLSATYNMAQVLEKTLKSNVMKKIICENLGIEEVDAKIQTDVMEGTNLLTLSVTADNARESIDIIRTIMDHYTEVSIYTVGNAVLNVLEEPKMPYASANPLDARAQAKKGFLAGAAICTLLFGLLSVMHNTVKQENEIEKKLDARSLGSISFEYKYKTVRDVLSRKKAAVLIDNPLSGFAFVESYKKATAKVEYQMAKEGRKALVVTSVSENEGKSTVAANLAISLADQGKKVILIDGDIRRPSQFLIFNQKETEQKELGEFLKGSGHLSDILITGERPRLFFLGGRNCYSSSTELLYSERVPILLEACRKSADYVIIDTPPAGLLGDAQVWAQHADAVLMVVRQNYMLAEDVNDILDEFRDGHAKILGVVLNGVKSFAGAADQTIGRYYGKYGEYGYYGHYNHRRK